MSDQDPNGTEPQPSPYAPGQPQSPEQSGTAGQTGDEYTPYSASSTYGQPYQSQPQPGQPYPGQSYPGQPQPGYPNQTPYPEQYGTGYPTYPMARQTDGISLAALITGVLALGPVALILGIIGINRTKKEHVDGRGMAITGVVLGAIVTVFYIFIFAIVFIAIQEEGNSYGRSQGTGNSSYYPTTAPSTGSQAWPTTDPFTSDPSWSTSWSEFDDDAIRSEIEKDPAVLSPLYESCKDGIMSACDDLFDKAEIGSELEWFAITCGGEMRTGLYCE